MRWKMTFGLVASVLLTFGLTTAASAEDWSGFIEKPGTTYVSTTPNKPAPVAKGVPATKAAAKAPAKAKAAKAKPRAKAASRSSHK
jgi:hypothetical protein